ncbi:MAG: heme-binding domain-containing protein [Pedobacter sp.]|jgi:hypothetical protein
MTLKKKILLGLLAVLVVIQFFKPELNQSAAETPNDIFAHYTAPDSLQQMIRTSCYDCHSNNTVYPWYSNIQPVAWWLANHVNEGKSELNFSEFATYTPKKADHKLEELIEMIEKGEMPLKSYTILHGDTRLSAVQQKAITDWAKEVRAKIQPNIQK